MGLLMRNNKFILRTENALSYRQKLWFVEYECNELYYYDILTKEVNYVCKIIDEPEYRYRAIGTIVANENKLYLIPFSGKKLYEVDIDSYELRGIDLRESKNCAVTNYNENAKFLSAHVSKDCIYMVGASYPGIVEYNCKTQEMICYDEWISELIQRKRFQDDAFFRKSILVGQKIYAPSCMSNVVWEFDIETKETHFYEVGSAICSYSSICQVDNVFWLSPRRNGPFVKWDYENRQWEEYTNFPPNYVPCEGSFADIIYWNNAIYAIPINAGMLIRIDKQNGIMAECKRSQKKGTSMHICVDDDVMYCFEIASGELSVVDLGGECSKREVVMPIEREKYHKKIWSHTYKILSGKCKKKEDEVLWEDYESALEDYIHYVGILEDGITI